MRINGFFRRLITLLLALSACYSTANGAENNPEDKVTITSGMEVLEDVNRNLGIQDVVNNQNFKVAKEGTLNLGLSNAAYWIRFRVHNGTSFSQVVVKVPNPALDSVALYDFFAPGQARVLKTGEAYPFYHKQIVSTDYLFRVNLSPGTEKYIYIRVASIENILVPVGVGKEQDILSYEKNKDIFWGGYIGLMLAMLLYNLFIFLTVRDRSYLYYIIYLSMVLMAQMTISGYAFQLLWPNNLLLAKYSAFFSPVLAGMMGNEFARHFLKTNKFLPQSNRIFFLLNVAYVIAFLTGIFISHKIGLQLTDMAAMLTSISILVVAAIIERKNYKPARYFLVAWIVFLVGVFIFVFKNLNILPYNIFTLYTMPVGSAMEALLLSFALADRINILKKEKEQTQTELLNAYIENERIIKEQNVFLESKVTERTRELSDTLSDLKNAQTQLVESEKMASLGQLTAGIAHEINNPINFVISNVTPLRRDINLVLDAFTEVDKLMGGDTEKAVIKEKMESLKEDIEYDYLVTEIDFLLKGISDGSERTAEIVKGLRIFSRLDENDIKKVNVNEGLDSTAIIVNSLLNNKITITRDYADAGLVECYAGKLNQVFLNIITNGIYAVKEKFGNDAGGNIGLKTRKTDDDKLEITISDNGVGMSEEVKHKVFEPFFTTKDVGEGTGLGLSIVHNIIKKHNGQIIVDSEPGAGTVFTIVIPFSQS